MTKLPDLTSEVELYRKSKMSDLTTSFGARLEIFQGQYTRSEERVDKIDPSDYRKMWQNDGQVSAIVKLPQLLMLGAGYKITPHENDSGEFEFVTKNIDSNDKKYGMRISLHDIIEDMSYAPFEGARFYELVYKIIEGKLLIDKVAPRDNITCYPVADDSGEFGGFVQYVQYMNKVREVFIPFDKAIAIIFNQNYGGLNGLSHLKSAWYHWDKKHKLYFIAHVASELQTVPPTLIITKGANAEVKGALENAVDNLGLQSRITVPEGEAEIQTLQNGGSPTVSLKELIDHHNSQISKSLLTQFIDLGSEGTSGGSRAVSVSQVDLYLDFVRGIARKIETAINDRIIAKLVDYNFGTDAYPKFTINPLGGQEKELMLEWFSKFVDKDGISTGTKSSIIQKVSEDMGIEFEEDEYEQMEIQKAMEAKNVTNATKSVANGVEDTVENDTETEIIDNSDNTELVELEDITDTRVDVKGHTKKIDSLTKQTSDRIAEILLSGLRTISPVIEQVVISGDIMKLSGIDIANRFEVVNALASGMDAMFDYAKIKASDEMGINAPKTDNDRRSSLIVSAQVNGAKIVDDLRDIVLNIVNEGVTKGKSYSEINDGIVEKYDGYITTSVIFASEQNILNAMNSGRKITHEANKDKIIGYEFSAVLDKKTTKWCRSLHKKQFEIDSKNLASVIPPCHFRCRSILKPVMLGDKFVPYKGKIPDFGSLWGFKDKKAVKNSELEKVVELGDLKNVDNSGSLVALDGILSVWHSVRPKVEEVFDGSENAKELNSMLSLWSDVRNDAPNEFDEKLYKILGVEKE